jgi:hypothetical protein
MPHIIVMFNARQLFTDVFLDLWMSIADEYVNMKARVLKKLHTSDETLLFHFSTVTNFIRLQHSIYLTNDLIVTTVDLKCSSTSRIIGEVCWTTIKLNKTMVFNISHGPNY